MFKNYILKDGVPVEEPDVIKWAAWMNDPAHRTIDKTEIGDTIISTVFLSADHNYSGEGPTIHFETMIFGGEYDYACERYATLVEAKEGHARWLWFVSHAEEEQAIEIPLDKT